MDFSKHEDKFAVKVNGIAVGHITNYSVTKHIYTDTTIPPYVVTIRRRVAPSPDREMLDFYSTVEFKVEIFRAGIKTTFLKCQTLEVLEEIGEDRLIYQTVTFHSFTRGITTE